ncbi:hypothetical protein CVU82_01475 [Candidatus Falkowbacteria bacterium HGW-Falkowbacteria-1]|uniref:LamG-like jellyroll fold domain-containing protein n=1 Tax=Candidatus Falkowbacteria bacterium HGW-Falkowbacteria-1 TaxID=2013768 RepID=A0A2N2E9A6_9BACT|nr:MAG: hypothetical protein CVU82_01475 [Candidatus Falkowbacteria bacterium HGW-Falkowbacteria-1]
MKTFFKNKKILANKGEASKAFTFLELIVVIAIIALVASIATVSLSNIRRTTRDKKVLANILEFQTALEAYKMIEGEYPDDGLVISGGELIGSSSGVTFFDSIPQNISYTNVDEKNIYLMSFELEGSTEGFSGGEKCAVSGAVINNSCCPGGLVSYWKGEGDANDSAGSNNGVFTNPSYTDGKFGQAFNFNGTNNYITLGSAVNFSVDSTLSFWANFGAISTPRYFIGDTSRAVGIRYSTEFLAFQGGANYTFVDWTKVNELVNVTIVKIDNYNFDFYINGSKIGTSYSGDSGTSILIDLIGKRRDGYFFLGPMDEVMIFDRELSGEEIQNLYNNKYLCSDLY